jgi:hypothetical protein
MYAAPHIENTWVHVETIAYTVLLNIDQYEYNVRMSTQSGDNETQRIMEYAKVTVESQWAYGRTLFWRVMKFSPPFYIWYCISIVLDTIILRSR